MVALINDLLTYLLTYQTNSAKAALYMVLAVQTVLSSDIYLSLGCTGINITDI